MNPGDNYVLTNKSLYNGILYVGSIALFGCLVSFIWLQLHNQRNTEYLIFFDFWRYFSAMKAGDSLYPYIFHNVHTHLVESTIWYLDVLVASGTLRCLHAYVFIVTFLALCTISIVIFRAYGANSRALLRVPLFTALSAAAVWLSPSNSTSFGYPIADVLASTLFLLLILVVLVWMKCEKSVGVSYGWLATYFTLATIGFLTFDTFLVAPLFLAFDAALRRRWKLAASQLAFVGLLFGAYTIFLNTPVGDDNKNLLYISHNFLVLLSSHYGLLFRSLGFSEHGSAWFSIFLAVIQLVAFGIFLFTYYHRPTAVKVFSKVAIVLATFGIVAIILATWLRFGWEITYAPVDRYTPYSIMFSIGVFFLAVDALQKGGNNEKSNACTLVGTIVLAINVAYIALEESYLLSRSHNAASNFIMARLEMPVYALSPGNELNIGPVEPNQGLDFRASLHDFLKERQLSVFASDGYKSVGTPFIAPRKLNRLNCLRRYDTDSPRRGGDYRYIVFDGVDESGIFLVVNKDNVITNFSFAGKITPIDRSVIALVPSEKEEDIYFARFKQGKVAGAVRCQLGGFAMSRARTCDLCPP